MGDRLADHFGVASPSCPPTSTITSSGWTSPPGSPSADGRTRYDWWGAGHDTDEEGYFIRQSPLAVTGDLDAFAWPDPRAAGLLDDAAASGRAWRRRLRRAQLRLRPVRAGLVAARLRAAPHRPGRDPEYVGALLDRITDIQLVLIERFLELGVDGGYFGDDYGAQAGLLFSPGDLAQLVKPRLARLFAPFRERGLPVLMHSDGHIDEIVPDLVEIGLTALNPVQPEVLDHAWLRATFGGRLAFYGGISTQTVLPDGSPAEVRRGRRGLPGQPGARRARACCWRRRTA